MKNLVCFVLVFLIASPGFAGHSGSGRRGRGILGGRPAAPGNAGLTRALSRTVMIKHSDTPDLCSGVMIEGCILTGGHCTRKEGERFVNHRIYTAAQPGPRDAAAYSGNEIEVLGEPRTPTDLAIIKVRGGLPRNAGITREALADARLDRPSQAAISGYGIFGTQETQKEGSFTYTDVGAGTRRVGITIAQGIVQVRDEERRPLGEFLRIGRGFGGAAMMGAGDSGGPLFIGNTLHGIAVAGQSYSMNAGDGSADNTFGGLYSPIAVHREAIIGAMDRLGCAKNISDPEP